MNEAAKPSKKERLKEELIKYGVISAYLYVCFAILALYKAASLEQQGVSWVPLGFAIIQALVIGKFILIGDALKVGRRADDHPLLHRIAWKTLAMLVMLVVFKAIEEVLVSLHKGVALSQAWEEFAARPVWVNLAPVLLMLLVLVPLVAAVEVYRSLGHEQFRDQLLKQRPEGA